jgi:hypothetical protein
VVCDPGGWAAGPVELDDDEVPAFDPVEFALPAALVPGAIAVGTFAALPAPLGSLTELVNPPGFAGPGGLPLTAAEPAPADPALGDPTALLVPVLGPLAAPPAEELPLPPPAPPPALCANAVNGAAERPRTSVRMCIRIAVLRFSQ